MAPAPAVRVREIQVSTRDVHTRMPFRFGKAVLTWQPVAHVRATIEFPDGKRIEGLSACGLPPLWFDKDASKTHADNIRDLLRSLEIASNVYRAAGTATPFSLHHACEPEARRLCAAEHFNDLTSGYGIALVDAAVIDATCRWARTPFHQGLRTNLFGLGAEFVRSLPGRPLDTIFIRHTVGMADPIVAADVTEPLHDGLPQTLEEIVREYRVTYFKLKISKDGPGSLERLRRIAAVLDRDAGDYHVTLDGNEQFSDMGAFLSFARAAAGDPPLAHLWRRTIWIEQPVERAASLTDAVIPPLRAVSRLKPVIIDESDGTDEAVDRALALGYRGISAKNCKGIYRTLHSYARVRETGAILSSEDLLNVPIVPLHQDLCVAAALGITHSERNGHHYVRGLSFLPKEEQESALREFPSLYRALPDGVPALRIADGAISMKEINARPFGT